MTTRMKENQLKAILILILFIVLTFQAVLTNAQTFTSGSRNVYQGLTGSFGIRSVDVASNIAKIDRTNPMTTGGQLGVVFGSRTLRTRIGVIGYYTSAGNTAGTTDLYESNVSVNFHPLAKTKSMVSPYLTGGVSYDRFSFFGYYLGQERGTVNFSQGESPFLGKIKQVNATAGFGLEFRLKDDLDFVHLFSEVRYHRNLSETTEHASFEQTELNNQVQVQVGISFGRVR